MLTFDIILTLILILILTLPKVKTQSLPSHSVPWSYVKPNPNPNLNPHPTLNQQPNHDPLSNSLLSEISQEQLLLPGQMLELNHLLVCCIRIMYTHIILSCILQEENVYKIFSYTPDYQQFWFYISVFVSQATYYATTPLK